jgi:hypothetical protein
MEPLAWRKQCILDGNWESDTLTEDLDLSYRALKLGIQISWKCGYPAELPAIISATRSNSLDGIKELKTSVKCRSRTNQSLLIENKSAWHVSLNSTMFLAIFTMAVLSVPMLYIKMSLPYSKSIWLANLLSSLPSSFISYWATFKSIHGGGFKNFLTYITLFITLYHSNGIFIS